MKSIKIDNHNKPGNRFWSISDINRLIIIDVYRFWSILIEYRNYRCVMSCIKNTISLGILLGADKVHVTQSCMLTGANHSVGFLASMTEELNSGLQKSRNVFSNTPFHSIILLLTRLYMDLCSRTFLIIIMFQLQENQNHTFRPA